MPDPAESAAGERPRSGAAVAPVGPLPVPGAGVAPPPDFDLRSLLIRFSVGVLVLIAMLGVLGALLREPTTAFARWYVGLTGLPGLLVAASVLDMVPQPVPSDVFMGFAHIAGRDFFSIGATTTVGSILGGTVAWLGARWAADRGPVRRYLAGPGAGVFALVQRYGTLALAVGAISPLPFSVTCYAAGAIKMPYRRFVLVCLLRGPRMFFYLWLIQLGWVAAA